MANLRRTVTPAPRRSRSGIQANARSNSFANRRSMQLVARVPRAPIYNGSYSFSRMAHLSIATTSGNGFTIGAGNYAGVFFVFTPLSITAHGNGADVVYVDIPGSTEITALWERIRIDKVEFNILAQGEDTNYTSGSANIAPRIFIANDYNDDSIASTTLLQTQQQAGCKYRNTGSQIGQPLRHVCYPKYQRVIQYLTGTNAFEPTRGFVNTGLPIPHYGVRVAVENAKTGTGNLVFAMKVYFTCTNVK